jgi:enoyl-CoA hydratase/carnithine racemase
VIVRIASGCKVFHARGSFGLTADQTGTYKAMQSCLVWKCKEMNLLCEEIDAEEAYRIGLVEYM